MTDISRNVLSTSSALTRPSSGETHHQRQLLEVAGLAEEQVEAGGLRLG